jgi:N-methylhydantoinase A
MADVALETSRAVLEVVTPSLETQVQSEVEDMVARARDALTQEGVAPEAMVFTPLVDARYRGQSYELTIPFSSAVASAFHDAHARAYGHAMPERAVEIVNLRLQATGLVSKPDLALETTFECDGGEAFLGRKQTVCEGRVRQVALYDRERLPPGARFDGPALVVQMDSTVYLAPGWSARVDGYRNLVLERT